MAIWITIMLTVIAVFIAAAVYSGSKIPKLLPFAALSKWGKFRRFSLGLLMILCVGWSAHTFVHLQMRHRVPFLDLPLLLLAGVAFERVLEGVLSRLKLRVSDRSDDKTDSFPKAEQ